MRTGLRARRRAASDITIAGLRPEERTGSSVAAAVRLSSYHQLILIWSTALDPENVTRAETKRSDSP